MGHAGYHSVEVTGLTLFEYVMYGGHPNLWLASDTVREATLESARRYIESIAGKREWRRRYDASFNEVISHANE